jgi:hypothetical protein
MRQHLLDVLETVAADQPRPADLCAAVAASAPNTRPLPQLTWAALCLVHRWQRRRWASDVVRDRLQAQVRQVAEGGEPLFGVVFGFPDWKYTLTRSIKHLTHRGTGERIHLGDSGKPWPESRGGFEAYLRCPWEPEAAAERLDDLFRACGAVFIVLRLLDECGLIRYQFEDMHERVYLSRRLRRYSQAVGQFLGRWADPAERLWQAVRIGDWPAALALARSTGDPALVALLEPRAEACRRRWLKLLRRWIGDYEVTVGECLGALAHAGAEDLPRYIEVALGDSFAVQEAVDLIENDPSWCPWVFDLLRTTLAKWAEWADEDLVPGYLDIGMAAAYASYLLRHRYRVDEVIGHLLRLANPPLEYLIRLALDYCREWFLPLARRGLRSPSALDRRTAAAVLALFDEGWSRAELAACLEGSGDWEATAESRLALRESRAAAAQQLAERWEAEHPRGASQAPDPELTREESQEDRDLTAVFSEEDGRDPEEKFRNTMARLFDLVRRNRDYAPPVGRVGGPNGPAD